MAEYIDRKAALEATTYCYDPLDKLWRRIRAIPAADVVKIIRCKDCKYKDHDGFCTGRGYPEQLVPDHGYCYKAKKMDESEDEDDG